MRNLQKILALALALIMSFSLVVTANAAFSDEADITDTYNEAVNVLSQLEVFKGYTDGTYQPQKSITRAEVAAIIYRIATGDVTDTQVSIYSDWNRFSDVHAGEWWAGYINYCANAEYIKGYGNGKFGPDDPVTGYEALAMILRAVGYGKMEGEFQGSDWAVQTAARANTLKVTKNVQNSALLNSAATRELVAELLFRSILVPTVEYNQFSGYSENDTNLGANLGLEAVKGVVVANEEADLYSEEVLAEGKTNLEVAENDIRTLDYSTGLDDIGESRYAYIKGAKVLAIGDTGENVKWETGDKTDISTDKKFRDKSGLDKTDDTEFYLNFGREGHFSCDQRLEFTVVFYNAVAEESFDKAYEDISKYAYAQNTDKNTDGTARTDNNWTVEWDSNADSDNETDDEISINRGGYEDIPAGNYPVSYNRVIRAEEEITAEEMNILQGIFAAADNDWQNGLDKDKVTGDVFVGTKSTKDNDEERDISNSISFRKFKDEYINSEAWDRNFEGNDRGEWLKIVDNDSDGKADYAFLTEYHLDEVVGAYTKSGETRYEYEILDTEDWDVVDYVDEVEIGTVVLTTEIDNKVTIKKAEILTDKIETVNFRDETVTTVGGETKKQSEIFNDTRMDETITNMEDGVEYNMYLDRFGNIRAYELAAGTKYALLTELYYDRYNNTQYVRDRDLIVEATAGEAKTAEFDVLNDKDGNDFLLDVATITPTALENWNELYDHFGNLAASTNAYGDWQRAYATHQDKNAEDARERVVLQPAINNLALDDTKKDYVGDIFQNASTNVARYVQTDDGVRITTAAEYARDKSSNNRLFYGWSATGDNVDYTTRYTQKDWQDLFAVNGKAGVGYNPLKEDKYAVYRYNYIELDCWDGIAADQIHYPIAGQRALTNGDNVDHAADDQYRDVRSSYVNAVHDTEYYIVNRGDEKVSYFTDYENVKKIAPEYIEAVYAVAENTEYDNNEYDYWVANVIVIEVNDQIGDVDNISLAFSNYKQTTQRVKFLDTLTTKYEGINAHVIPDGADWGPRWEDYGFYKLYDTEKDGDELLADDIVRIKNGEYNTNGIYAGVVTRVDKVSGRGGYIDVDLHDAGNSSITREAVAVKDGAAYLPSSMQYIYAIDGDEAVDSLTVTSKNTGDLRTGDHIIWVTKTDDAKTTYYVVVVSDKNDNDGHNHDWKSPSWLKTLYADIISEQRGEGKTPTETPDVTVKIMNAVVGGVVTEKIVTADDVVTEEENGYWKINTSYLNSWIQSSTGLNMANYTVVDSTYAVSAASAKYCSEPIATASGLTIPSVTGPVVVEVYVHSSEKSAVSVVGTATEGTKGTVTSVKVDGNEVATGDYGSGSPVSTSRGSKVVVEFTAPAGSTGYYTINGGAVQDAESLGNNKWRVTEYVGDSALAIVVSSSAEVFYRFSVVGTGLTLANVSAKTADTDLTDLNTSDGGKVTVQSTEGAAHYTYDVSKITVDGNELVKGTDYTVNENGEITFAGTKTLTGDMVITATKTAKEYTVIINTLGYVTKIGDTTIGTDGKWEATYTYGETIAPIALTPASAGTLLSFWDENNTVSRDGDVTNAHIKIDNDNKMTITNLTGDVEFDLDAPSNAEKLAQFKTAVEAINNLTFASADPASSVATVTKLVETAARKLAGTYGGTVVSVAENASAKLSEVSFSDTNYENVVTKWDVSLKVGNETPVTAVVTVKVTDSEWKTLMEVVGKIDSGEDDEIAVETKVYHADAGGSAYTPDSVLSSIKGDVQAAINAALAGTGVSVDGDVDTDDNTTSIASGDEASITFKATLKIADGKTVSNVEIAVTVVNDDAPTTTP